MHPIIQLVASQYQTNTGLVMKTIEDIKPGDIHTRPMEKANSLLWITGHCANYRYLTTTLKAAWSEVSDKMMKQFELADAALLNTSCERELPGDATIKGKVTFLSLHECYHLGQLAYIRRLLGYGQVFG